MSAAEPRKKFSGMPRDEVQVIADVASLPYSKVEAIVRLAEKRIREQVSR